MSDQEQPNPYSIRDHESGNTWGRDDVMAVAGLLGQVSGTLSEIDKKNVGGESPFIKARKIDPKTTLKQMVQSTGSVIPQNVSIAAQQTQPVVDMIPSSTTQSTQPQPVNLSSVSTDLENRVSALEKIVEIFKRVCKFKRGVSYNVTTSKMAGNFKDPEMILDIVASELAKQTRSITIKLNDNSKSIK